MRIEQIHASLEAARDERARYLAEALRRGLARVVRSVRRGFGGGARPVRRATAARTTRSDRTLSFR